MADYTDHVSKEMLVRPISLEEYESIWGLASIAESDPRFRTKLERHRAEVIKAMKMGDQLWEWRVGTEAFSSAGGLAVIRGEEIVWARLDWRS
jgi:hypothetical protein